MKFSSNVVEKLLSLAQNCPVWVTGGAVRDALLGRESKDLDLTVPSGSRELSSSLAKELGGKNIVLHEEEGVFRLALPDGNFLDFSDFRKGSTKIEEDLRWRDFTVNALAVSLEEFFLKEPSDWRVIDPTGGRTDLVHRLIRAISRANLEDDPLRLLRAYRQAAELRFRLEEKTRSWIKELATQIKGVAKERVGAEIKALFSSPAGKYVRLMKEDGLLFVIFPELEEAEGVAQPSFHHLDVLGHMLLSLEMADEILADPYKFFGSPSFDDPFKEIISAEEEKSLIRLAALFHDVGKPKTFAVRHRITFYEHDRVGAELFEEIGARLALSKKFTRRVALLIRNHMRPFHLLREFRLGRLTKRALRRLLKDVPDYVSLFFVAMADSLASAGPDKEEDLERDLARLFWEVHRFREETLVLQEKERLVTGRDLIEIFGLEPGPIFRELLEAVEEARVEGQIKSREEALSFLTRLITQRFSQS